MRVVVMTLLAGSLVAEVKPIPKDRSEDSYAVYSAVLASHPERDPKYLIEGTTGLRDSTPRTCVRVPANYAAKLDEVVADYVQHDAETFQLERKFEIDKPYELLSEADVKQFMHSRMLGRRTGDKEEPEKFRDAIHLLSFSNVYFDQAHTFAVVRTRSWCGGLCASWTWQALVKENGLWVEKPWGGCPAEAGLQDHGLGEKKDTLSMLGSTATSKKPTIISSQLCSPHFTSALGSGLRGLFAELSQ